jgi:hypothetical protein
MILRGFKDNRLDLVVINRDALHDFLVHVYFLVRG